jgi:hypothetical protein
MESMSKQSNRALMPKVTEFVDACREEFGNVKVTYAAEGGIVKGALSDPGVVVSDIFPVKVEK